VKKKKSIAIAGAGFFGLSTAIYLANKNYKVKIFEKNSQAMQEASLLNQARVHGGYHYPRSLVTAARSRANYSRFITDYNDAIANDFSSLYAVARESKVSAKKFLRLMKLIGAPIDKYIGPLTEMFDQSLITDLFVVNEVSFNSDTLMRIATEQATSLGVEIVYGCEVTEIKNVERNGQSEISLRANSKSYSFDYAILCTYGNLDFARVELSRPNFVYEVCELVRVKPPEIFQSLAITIMDGPFWSLTPWPVFGEHVLTHVRHTPHARFNNIQEARKFMKEQTNSRAELMLRDASRFLPPLSKTQIIGNEKVVKTILQTRDYDDARPIHIQSNRHVISILGSKIDHIFEIEDILDKFLEA